MKTTYLLTTLIATCTLLSSTNLVMAQCTRADVNKMYIREDKESEIHSAYKDAVSLLSDNKISNQSGWASPSPSIFGLPSPGVQEAINTSRQEKLTKIDTIWNQLQDMKEKYIAARENLGLSAYTLINSTSALSSNQLEMICRMGNYYGYYTALFLGYLCALTKNCNITQEFNVFRMRIQITPSGDSDPLMEEFNAYYQNFLDALNKLNQ